VNLITSGEREYVGNPWIAYVDKCMSPINRPTTTTDFF
jgi:hypothetical protein